jgi:hypothetical protein
MRGSLLFLTFALFFLVTPWAKAQVLYGALNGTVTDPSNAAIAGAKVDATEMLKGIRQETITDSTGLYRFSELLPGTWKISVSASGLNTSTTENIRIDPNNMARVDAQLSIAQATSTVTVTSAPPELQTDRADVHTDISSVELQGLPSVSSEGKNFQGLLRIIPGSTIPVENNSAAGNPARGMTVNVNGQSSQGNGTRIDGVSDAYPWLPNNVAYVPASDAIESVNIATNSYDAEQGGMNGAAVNVQIKTGSNKFHGDIHEFHTDDQLKALNFFTNPTPGAFHRPIQIFNQFGAAVGGPILKDKLFFFGDYQGTRQILAPSAASAQTVPTGNLQYSNAKAAGYFDFSGLTNTKGDAVVIYDPNTGNPDGTGRTPFPNNRIPLSRVDPAALTLAALIPAPTTTGTTGNYVAHLKGNFTTDQYDAKVNFVPSQKSQIFGRFSTQNGTIFDPPSLGAAGGNATNGGQPGNAATKIYIIGLGSTHTFTPNLLVDGNLGFTRQHLLATDTDIAADGAYGLNTLKIPGTNTGPGGTSSDQNYWGIPSFQFQTFANLGNASTGNPFVFRDNQYVENENLTWIKGHHQIRVGGEWDHVQMNHFQPQGGSTQTARGTLVMNGIATEPVTCTGGPPITAESCSPTTGLAPSSTQFNSFADFLLGLPQLTGKATQIADPIAIRWSTWSFYARDQWQVTPKLSANLGVRWELYPMAYSDHGKGARILDSTSGTTNFMNVLIGGYGSVPKNDGVNVGHGMFEPRIGIAYQVTPKTVVRMGGAMGSDSNNWRYLRNDYPSVINTSYTGTSTGGTNYSSTSPAASFTGTNATGPYAGLPIGIVAPALPNVTTGAVPLALSINTSTIGQYPNFRRGYIYSYNFTVEQQFAGFVGDIGYVGAREIRPIENTNLNAAPIGGGQAGELLNTAAVSAGLIPSGKSYGSISTLIPLGHTYYDSMQAKIARRIGEASQVGVLYTWSRAEDFEDNEELNGISRPYPAYFAWNKAKAGFDRKYNFEGYWVYQEPTIHPRILNDIVGGFTFSGVLSRLAGSPFTLTDGGAGNTILNDNGTNTQTVNIVGNFKITNGLPPWSTGVCATGATTCRYFDPSTVARVTTAAFGTAGRNWVVGPGYFDVDANLQRDFKIREYLTFQFEAQCIGLTNTPHFGNPTSDINSANFGIISSELQGSNASGLGGSQGERLWFFGGKFVF